MNLQSKLEDLKAVAAKLSIEIRYSDLRDNEFSIQSGYCKLKNKDMIILDKTLPAEEEIHIILKVLETFDLENVFIVPWVRERLENSNFPELS